MSEFIQEFSSKEDVISSYTAPQDALDNAIVHLAWYGYGSYCGYSLVIFEKDGKLYEVNGSHCSCHGLEGQWEPEETSWEALKMRNLSGDSEYDGASDAQNQLQKVISEHTNG
jgi:hypothetical protein